jgi:hypothetical protein
MIPQSWPQNSLAKAMQWRISEAPRLPLELSNKGAHGGLTLKGANRSLLKTCCCQSREQRAQGSKQQFSG